MNKTTESLTVFVVSFMAVREPVALNLTIVVRELVMERERFVSVKEVAEYLTIKRSTIYKWTHEEFIPHYKVKGAIRFKLSEIDNWMSRKKVTGREQRRIALPS